MKQKRLISLFVLILQSLSIFAGNISKDKELKNIMDLVGKNLLGKVGSICFETDCADYSMSVEIFLKINIGKEYITITEKEVKTMTDKKNDSVKNNYNKEQRFLYKIKDNKIFIDNKNNKSLSNYELTHLELKNEKIIGYIKGVNKKIEFWEDLTSIYNYELEEKIDNFEGNDGDIVFIYMRVKIIGDDIFFSTGVEISPCGTIEYDNYKKYSYTQQQNYIQLHFTSKQKKEEGYKLLLLSMTRWGNLGERENNG